MKRDTPLFTETELRRLLEMDEGQYLEFKSLWDRSGDHPSPLPRREVRDLITECIAAFANADGGTLILGVDDDGTPTGHGYPEEALSQFLTVPELRLRPGLHCRTQRIVVDGAEVVLFEVSIAAEAVMVEGNGFPYRAGDQVLREPQEVINQRKRAYRDATFEQRVAPEATIADLDLDLASSFLRPSVLRDRPIEDALARYGLVQARGAEWGVTHAALLLFGRPPLVRWHPRAGIRFFRVDGIDRRHGAARNVTQLERIELPLAQAISIAHEFARTQIKRSERLHDLFFREMPEYPEFAWQEAIVNAFAHRDYETRTQEIEVWFYADRFEVASPGGPVPPVTIEALSERRAVHAARNPLLVRVLADAGLMREEGEGVPRMFAEMEASMLRHPTFEFADSVFRITLRNEPMFVGPSPEWNALVGSLPVSVAQRRVLAARPEGFTNEDFRRLNDVDRDEAYRQIRELVTSGVLTAAESPGRGAVYHLAPDLRASKLFLESHLPTLREYFGRSPVLKNEDYRRLFEATRYEAARDLRRLVEDGYLRREGERRGARYLPGPLLGGSEK